MITEWFYSSDFNHTRNKVKQEILNNNYHSIDVGASFNFWSYPECRTIADSVEIKKDGIEQFKIDLENKASYKIIYEYVEKNGKFDFSICSHTLEDLFNPLDVLEFLPLISRKGFIAIPSKYDEFTYLYANKYLGNAHHKTIFDIKNNEIVCFPKFSFIETNINQSQKIRELYKGKELCIFWKDIIPYKIFGNGIPFTSDDSLINAFYNDLIS